MNRTHRIEPSFFFTRIEPFFDITQRIEQFYLIKNITQRIELLFLKITQRIESFLTWLKELNFFPVWLTELNFFGIRLTEMDLFLEYDAKNWTLISWIWRKELNRLIFENYSQNWTFFFRDSKNWTFFHMTQRIELIFWMTQRIDLLCMTQGNELFSISTHRIELVLEHDSRDQTFFFFENDSKTWTLFSLKMTQRIEPFSGTTWRIESFFDITQRIDFFQYDAKNSIFFSTTHRIQPFLKYDSQKWSLFLWIRPENWTLYFLSMTQRIEPFISWIWRKELNILFLEYDAMNWTV